MKNRNPLWTFFCSVKLTVVLLLSLAVTSIIGTLIKQNESPAYYVQKFGEFRYQLIHVLGVNDMYHAWWFQGLLLLLTINIVACSIDRLKSTWKLIFNRNPTVRPERFSQRSDAHTFRDQRDAQALTAAAESVVDGRFGVCKVENSDERTVIFGEKGRLSRLGVYIVHLSVICMLVGGLVGSLFGFEGFVNIAEGEATDIIRLRNTGAIHQLDFEIRCNDFNLELYDNGSPKEYRSSLSLLADGKELTRKEIVVNDPLRFAGINIFQSSYGPLPPEAMPKEPAPAPAAGPADSYTLTFTSRESGMNYTREAKVGEPLQIPEGLGRFVIMTHEAKTDFRGMDVGAALKGVLTPAEGEPVEVLLPLKFANFDKMRSGKVIIAVANQPHEGFAAAKPVETRYYTGLQVTRDPGVWLVYTGFILMIVGCFVTFYLSHQQVCVIIEPAGKKRQVTVSGIANRNPLAMKTTVEKLLAAIRQS